MSLSFGAFLKFWRNPEIQFGRHLTIMIPLQRHMTSSLHVADVKGDIFGRTISPPSVIVIAFYAYEAMEGGGGGGAWERNPKKQNRGKV